MSLPHIFYVTLWKLSSVDWFSCFCIPLPHLLQTLVLRAWLNELKDVTSPKDQWQVVSGMLIEWTDVTCPKEPWPVVSGMLFCHFLKRYCFLSKSNTFELLWPQGKETQFSEINSSLFCFVFYQGTKEPQSNIFTSPSALGDFLKTSQQELIESDLQEVACWIVL